MTTVKRCFPKTRVKKMVKRKRWSLQMSRKVQLLVSWSVVKIVNCMLGDNRGILDTSRPLFYIYLSSLKYCWALWGCEIYHNAESYTTSNMFSARTTLFPKIGSWALLSFLIQRTLQTNFILVITACCSCSWTTSCLRRDSCKKLNRPR